MFTVAFFIGVLSVLSCKIPETDAAPLPAGWLLSLAADTLFAELLSVVWDGLRPIALSVYVISAPGVLVTTALLSALIAILLVSDMVPWSAVESVTIQVLVSKG